MLLVYIVLFVGYIMLYTDQNPSLRQIGALEVWNIIK